MVPQRTANISVVIAGERLFAWKSLQKCLAKEPVFILIRCADNISDVFFCCQRVMPCVLLIEQAFIERIDPVGFANRINFGRSIQVLVKLDRNNPEMAERFLRMGCAGVLVPDVPARTLARAVRTVASGELWAGRKIVSRMLKELLAGNNPGKLTHREIEILGLIARGYRNKEIAERLFLSFETVRWHIRSLYSKIGVHDRVSAALYGMEQPGEQPEVLLPPASDNTEEFDKTQN